jgi:D-alanyl-D-alanine carboxypeptidase
VLDTNTGQVLFSRNADAQRFPASLTKIMTLYLVFEAMETGRISKSTPIPISRKAAAEPPSKLGLRAGSTITVENAIKALVTRSANDIATAVGEFLGGSEANFARMMTAKARQLGMNSTTFQNAHGLPNNRRSRRRATWPSSAWRCASTFPTSTVFQHAPVQFRRPAIGNHNRLLGRVTGVDGIKTGFIRASGFNLVTSVRTGGRSIVAVVMGGRTGASRDDHMAALIREHLPRASTRQPSQPLVARGTPLRSSASRGFRDARAHAVPAVPPAPAAGCRLAPAARTPPRRGGGTAVARSLPALQRTQTRICMPPSPIALRHPCRSAIRPGRCRPPVRPHPGVDTMTTNSTVRPAAGQSRSVRSAARKRPRPSCCARQGGRRHPERRLAIHRAVHPQRNNYVRARFGGFQSSKEAWDACNALKRKRMDCFAAEL